MEIVRFYLERGISANEPYTDFGWTAFHEACANGREEVVELLIQHRVDIHHTSEYGATGLHAVCFRTGNIGTAKVLLRNGARIHAKYKERFTPLDTAYQNGQDKLAAYLTKVYKSPALYTLFGPDIARDLFVSS